MIYGVTLYSAKLGKVEELSEVVALPGGWKLAMEVIATGRVASANHGMDGPSIRRQSSETRRI